MTDVPFSLRRVWLITHVTSLEAARQRVFPLLLVVALGLVLGAQAFREFNFGASELKFIADFGFGALTVFGSILTIAATAQLFCGEIEDRTTLTLLAKPVRRAEFVLGKLGGIMGVVTLFCVVVTLLLVSVLYFRERALRLESPELFEHGPLIQYADVVAVGIAQGLKFGVLAALTLLVASFAQSHLYTVIVSFAVLMICHFHAVAQLAYLRTDSWLLGFGIKTIALIFPDFRIFDLGDLVGNAGAIDAVLLARIACYAGLHTAAVASLTIYSFSQREI